MLQKIIGACRKAIDDYNMIDDGDKIAIGLSGGKDSIALLYALYYLRKFYPKKYDIMAITIHPGLDNFKTDKLEQLCKQLDIEYVVYNSNIAKVVFEIIAGVLLILTSVAIIVLVMLQDSTEGMSSAVTGDIGESYLSNNRGRTKEEKLKKFTKFAVIVFMVLTLAVGIVAKFM